MAKPFNDTTTKTGLLQNCEEKLFGDNGYGKITSDTNRLYQFTNKINDALDSFWKLALTADGRWQIDDNNNTDYPEATTNLISGQRDYQFALEHLEIEKVLIKDSSGKWTVLTKTIDVSDNNDLDTKSYLENNTGNSGTPSSYDKRGNTLFLQTIPNYASSLGLKVIFKRGPSYFVYTDTTKVPGIASDFHGYLSLKASTVYAVEKTMPVANGLLGQVAVAEGEIKDFYSRRTKDEKRRMGTNQESTR